MIGCICFIYLCHARYLHSDACCFWRLFYTLWEDIVGATMKEWLSVRVGDAL
jgi:hypothetical protein